MCNCQKVKIFFKRLNENAIIPKYETEGAAGFDLSAAEELIIFPGDTLLIHTGLAVEIPPGYEMQIRPRSGISLKTTLIAKNTIGTIDSDYRGEIGIILHNLSEHDRVRVNIGDRLAQGVISKLPAVEIIETIGELSTTGRGTGGYGSTGMN